MEADKTNRKVLMISFVAAGALVTLVTGVLFDTLGGMFSPVERLRAVEGMRHILPLALGFITFLALQFNPKIKVWGDEVVSEIRKIVWPSQKDTVAQTIAVCVMVVIAGLGLSMIDYVSSLLIKYIVN